MPQSKARSDSDRFALQVGACEVVPAVRFSRCPEANGAELSTCTLPSVGFRSRVELNHPKHKTSFYEEMFLQLYLIFLIKEGLRCSRDFI